MLLFQLNIVRENVAVNFLVVEIKVDSPILTHHRWGSASARYFRIPGLLREEHLFLRPTAQMMKAALVVPCRATAC